MVRETQIHSVKHGGQYAHVCLGTGYNERVNAFIAEKRRKAGLGKRGIGGLFYNGCWRYQPR